MALAHHSTYALEVVKKCSDHRVKAKGTAAVRTADAGKSPSKTANISFTRFDFREEGRSCINVMLQRRYLHTARNQKYAEK